MAEDMAVTSKDIHEVYRRVKEVGDGQLRKDITRAIREATNPAKEAVKASALAELPKRGGLAAMIAKSRVTNQVKTGASTAGVRIKASNAHDIGAMDRRGMIRHPTFGHNPWVNQPIPNHWFSKPLEATAPVVRERIQAVLRKTAADLKN